VDLKVKPFDLPDLLDELNLLFEAQAVRKGACGSGSPRIRCLPWGRATTPD
jgi:hypothetical protein